MPHSTDPVEDDQEWELVSGMEELTLPEKQISVSTTPYTITIGKHTRKIKCQDIEERNHQFEPLFDEERRFKHNDWPDSTKRIILGHILYRDVLKELKAKDPKKTRLLQFISLLTFREHARNITAVNLRVAAEMEVAHTAWELPFADILQYLVKTPTWCAFDQDNALLMILVQRLNAWGDNIPVAEISHIVQSWPEEDMSPTNLVLKFTIELKLELQGCRGMVRDLADQVTEAKNTTSFRR